MAETTIFYHADCLDGFGAAYAAWRQLGDAARYRPLHHGQSWNPEDVRGCQVVILDFSFARPQLEAMATEAAGVFQLDHHGTARDMWQQELGPVAPGLQHYQHPTLPLKVAFDLGKSGARLAWEHFHPAQPVPLALQHIEDQDLWKFTLPETRAFCRALRLRPFDFTSWDLLVGQAESSNMPTYRQLCAEGAAIDRFMEIEVERLAQSSQVMPARLKGEAIDPLQAQRHGLPVLETDGGCWRAIPGLAINANSLFTSELGHLLAQQSGTYGLIWQLAGDGKVKASLRAENRVNVALIAEQYGGGGHPNAAAFRMELDRFKREVLGLA